MEHLDPRYSEWEKEDLNRILKENPYVDENM